MQLRQSNITDFGDDIYEKDFCNASSDALDIRFRGSLKLTFDGESCGNLQCDSVTLQEGNAAPVVLEQPIHGLNQIECQP